VWVQARADGEGGMNHRLMHPWYTPYEMNELYTPAYHPPTTKSKTSSQDPFLSAGDGRSPVPVMSLDQSLARYRSACRRWSVPRVHGPDDLTHAAIQFAGIRMSAERHAVIERNKALSGDWTRRSSWSPRSRTRRG
jgi:hypothetical protein